MAQVSTPLALNIYTAVHNPISLKGRIQIINGALDHVDLRPLLKDIHVPVLAVHSTQVGPPDAACRKTVTNLSGSLWAWSGVALY
jgi:hypothetical protein